MAIGVGQSQKGGTSGATSASTTAVNTSAAGSIITGAFVFQGTAAATAFDDNKSNSYTQINSEQTVDTTNSAKIRAYYKENASGGSGHTTTSHTTTSQPQTIAMIEITGAATASALATSNGGTDTSSPFGNAVSITPAAGNYLLVAYFGGNSGSNPATHAESQGFSIVANTNETNGASFWTICIATKSVTADGVTAYTAQFTETGGSQAGVILAAFKELAGGGGVTVKALAALGVG